MHQDRKIPSLSLKAVKMCMVNCMHQKIELMYRIEEKTGAELGQIWDYGFVETV